MGFVDDSAAGTRLAPRAPRGVSRAGEADFEAFAIRSRILGAAQIFTTFAHCLVRRLSSRTVPRE